MICHKTKGLLISFLLPPGTGEGLFIAPAPASGAPATGNVSVTCCAVGAGK